MSHQFNLSFEFFPPKSLDGSFKLWSAVDALIGFEPDLMTVTYGAGGSTRQITREAVDVLGRNYGVPVAGHLTCVDASMSDVLSVVSGYAKAGVRDIVALRGDPVGDHFVPHPEGFKGSLELIETLALMNKFRIHVAAYPTAHPEAASAHADMAHLKAKFDAGADRAITQFFFEAEDFLRYRDRCVAAGITQPIVPGILPIENWAKTKVFARKCGVEAPSWMDQAYRNAGDDAKLLSTAICSEMCDTLLNEGVEDLHFYTLNDPTLTADVCRALGRQQAKPALKVA